MVEPTEDHDEPIATDVPRNTETESRGGGEPSDAPEPPGPLTPEMEALEASIRLKLDQGEPLTQEERTFFARMPADKEIPPEDVRGSG